MSTKNEGITKGLLGKRVSECTRDELVELLEMVVYNPVDGPFSVEVRSPLGLLTSNPQKEQIQEVCQEAANRLSTVDNRKFCDELDKSIQFLSSTCTQVISHLWGAAEVQKALDTTITMRNVLSAMQDSVKKHRF